MRVISGSLRGLKLDTLSGMDTRPTLDRVKEALFSMLFDRTYDAVGLDLFAGSGALGIELLSRLGKECTFVDINPDAIKVIGSNIKKARLEDRAFVKRQSFSEFLKTTDKKFDIIFMDPPYEMGLYDDALSIIYQRGLLSFNGVIVLECKSDYEVNPGNFTIIKDKTYGKVRLCVLEMHTK